MTLETPYTAPRHKSGNGTSIYDALCSGLRKWLSLAGEETGSARLIYSGDERQRRDKAAVVAWREPDGFGEAVILRWGDEVVKIDVNIADKRK
jgi:hypothetical protein